MALLGSLQIERIRRNYQGGDLSARELIDILQHQIAFGAERASRELVRRMGAHGHYNKRAHTEGSRDQTPHYLIRINNKGHHLRLDSHGIVFQITDDTGHDLGAVPPWVAPGSP